MTTLRERCIEAGAERLARLHNAWATQMTGCRETHPCYTCETQARVSFDAVLAVLGEHANEWDTGDVYQQEMFRKNQGVFWIIPVEGLLADPEGGTP